MEPKENPMTTSQTNTSKLIVVSNRLPIAISKEGDEMRVSSGSGGLVTAMAPVLQNRGGIWIGWAGSVEKGLSKYLREFSREAGYLLRPVPLDEQDIQDFYRGFANEILWPLFHEFQMPNDYKTSYWEAYQTANEKFAAVAAASSKPGDFVWVHDYHLMLQASLLKKAEVERHTGFFLHIPFPPADIFLKLPWRKEIVDALLDFDLLGFQTLRDRFNFFDVVRRLYPKASKHGRGAVATLTVEGKKLRIGTFPISIDFSEFSQTALKPEVQARAKEIHAALGERFLIFGVDRLDYTKGVPHRLSAFKEALTKYPELRERVCMAQVLVPSRQEVPQYQAMKVEVERMVGELNGHFGTPAWTPVHYMYRSLDREELVSYYLAADMALVTSLRDGMNLVAKEYAACNVTERGVLCLSEFAGAAMEFHHHAIMINPFDIVGVADAIWRSVNMSITQRKRRMRRIRSILRHHDIFQWLDSFLMAAFSKRLTDFPTLDWETESNGTVQGPPWTDKA